MDYQRDEIINDRNLINNKMVGYNIIDNCSIIKELKEFHYQRDYERKERNFKFLIIIILVFIVVIILGSIIFMFVFDLTWLDALYASSLILTGIDIEVTPITDMQKIFIIFYALVTVLILLSMANAAIAYFFELL